jgi:hypothetical protein
VLTNVVAPTSQIRGSAMLLLFVGNYDDGVWFSSNGLLFVPSLVKGCQLFG